MRFCCLGIKIRFIETDYQTCCDSESAFCRRNSAVKHHCDEDLRLDVASVSCTCFIKQNEVIENEVTFSFFAATFFLCNCLIPIIFE